MSWKLGTVERSHTESVVGSSNYSENQSGDVHRRLFFCRTAIILKISENIHAQ
jgi:hypothetical protein